MYKQIAAFLITSVLLTVPAAGYAAGNDFTVTDEAIETKSPYWAKGRSYTVHHATMDGVLEEGHEQYLQIFSKPAGSGSPYKHKSFAWASQHEEGSALIAWSEWDQEDYEVHYIVYNRKDKEVVFEEIKVFE
ncbi:hypothetical protein [Paenibacillus turpanensis]|uniref:hypothetical protein n=1 Tax=Paenibacillus turpanensis TaxID=2689078 RepID=UPI00140AEEEF|nr:hypothetical protein [Paenibacillus turpanensis]